MIRMLIKVGLLLVVGILGYNYFFGDSEEKAQSKKVFREVGEVARSVGSLIRSEREKFNEGKYDNALEKLGNAYQGLKKQAKYLDENVLQRLEAAEKRRAALREELKGLESEDAATEPATKPVDKKKAAQLKKEEEARAVQRDEKQKALRKQIEDLQKEFEELATEAEKGN